jgi:hypothetical protein
MQMQSQSAPRGDQISSQTTNNIVTLQSGAPFSVQLADGVQPYQSHAGVEGGTICHVIVQSGSVEVRVHPNRTVTVHPMALNKPMVPMNGGQNTNTGMGMSAPSQPLSMYMEGMPPMVLKGQNGAPDMTMNTSQQGNSGFAPFAPMPAFATQQNYTSSSCQGPNPNMQPFVTLQ